MPKPVVLDFRREDQIYVQDFSRLKISRKYGVLLHVVTFYSGRTILKFECRLLVYSNMKRYRLLNDIIVNYSGPNPLDRNKIDLNGPEVIYSRSTQRDCASRCGGEWRRFRLPLFETIYPNPSSLSAWNQLSDVRYDEWWSRNHVTLVLEPDCIVAV